LVLTEFVLEDGTEVRLRDYGTAGEDGSGDLSWLRVRNI
jgi:hypothetical protein